VPLRAFVAVDVQAPTAGTKTTKATKRTKARESRCGWPNGGLRPPFRRANDPETQTPGTRYGFAFPGRWRRATAHSAVGQPCLLLRLLAALFHLCFGRSYVSFFVCFVPFVCFVLSRGIVSAGQETI
jgi:hypothetical protein